MNRTQLNELMNKTQAYHEAYLKAYKKSKENSKSNKSKKNLLPFLIFISIPFIFSIFLNLLLLNNNNNESKVALNKSYNYSDEIIYKDILEKDLFSQNNYSINKFKEVNQDYRNNFSNKFTSLKKANLSNNVSERKKKFINISIKHLQSF